MVPVLVVNRLTEGCYGLLWGRLRWLLVAFHHTLSEGRLAAFIKAQLERLLATIPSLRRLARLVEELTERLHHEYAAVKAPAPPPPPRRRPARV